MYERVCSSELQISQVTLQSSCMQKSIPYYLRMLNPLLLVFWWSENFDVGELFLNTSNKASFCLSHTEGSTVKPSQNRRHHIVILSITHKKTSGYIHNRCGGTRWLFQPSAAACQGKMPYLRCAWFTPLHCGGVRGVCTEKKSRAYRTA